MDLSNLIYAFVGGLLTQIGSWLAYKRETPIDKRSRIWEKSRSFNLTPRAWDCLFSDGCWYWLKITLSNGLVITGKYGAESFASSFPHKEDIYLEDIWILNDNESFSEHQHRGAFIERKNIILMEFHSIEYGGKADD